MKFKIFETEYEYNESMDHLEIDLPGTHIEITSDQSSINILDVVALRNTNHDSEFHGEVDKNIGDMGIDEYVYDSLEIMIKDIPIIEAYIVKHIKFFDEEMLLVNKFREQVDRYNTIKEII